MVNTYIAELKPFTHALGAVACEASLEDADVLVVSETDARSLRGMMLGAGHTVKALRSSSAAGAYLKDHNPKCIIVDADLSGMNGTSVVDRLKRTARFEGVPMIVLVEPVSPLRTQAEFCKADKVLLKPFGAVALTHLVSSFMREAEAVSAQPVFAHARVLTVGL